MTTSPKAFFSQMTLSCKVYLIEFIAKGSRKGWGYRAFIEQLPSSYRVVTEQPFLLRVISTQCRSLLRVLSTRFRSRWEIKRSLLLSTMLGVLDVRKSYGVRSSNTASCIQWMTKVLA